ncbi:MAG: MFS transporter [Acidobacteria bacterium 13_1_20CM_3_53_8]|nr:MAG: MFS transporter [Acidobacteria bacterium 13_1_20CM_3_53_8]
MSPQVEAKEDRETGSSRWRVLLLLALAELLGMSLWFSASAIVPALKLEWHLSESAADWLTLAVQLGFVAGTLLSALFNLPDIINSRHLFTVSAICGAIVNGAFALLAHDATTGIILRFLTGMFLAGVYPPGMKIMATWFRRGRGFALGVLVGALTLGKASPYLVNAIGSSAWRVNVAVVSVLAAAGGLIVLLFIRDGPFALPSARFDWRQVTRIFENRGVRLANFGYFGHMWELYAMWTWMPVMIRASLSARGSAPTLAEAASFLVIGAGAAGCVVGGLLADRVGRTLVTSWAMIVSGSCSVIIGLLFELNPLLLLTVATIWGASVVADSAQFSTCVTELGDPQYMGTALTLQTCLGFLLTMVSIELIPRAVNVVGWRYAFAILAIGPIFGVASMLRLRALPEAMKIAQGKR